MKKNIILLIVLCGLTIKLSAQEKKTYWDNGNLKSITNYDEIGNETGYWKTYYENGELETYGYYENGKKTGNWDEYYYNGKRRKTIYYIDNKMTRKSVYFDNGNTMVSGSFDDNQQKDGRWEQFYINWRQKISGEYAHGKKHGKWQYYTEKGDLFKVEYFDKGILKSTWADKDKKNVGSNGTASDAVVEETVEIAVETVVDAAADAVEASDSYYYGNRPNGEWKFYNDNGNIIEIGNYLKDRKEGKWISYYDNGQIKMEQLFKDDKLMEVVSYFDKTGKPLEIGTLTNGNGTLKEYDIDNKLINTTEYASGEKINWNDWSRLNSLAWYIYEDETDKDALQQGIKLVKRSLEIERNYYNTDTYAALLFKTGKYKKALVLAKEAIAYAKKNGNDYSSSTELVRKINKKLK